MIIGSNNKYIINKIFFLLLLGFSQPSFSQENEIHERSEELSHDATSHLNHFKKHSLGLVMSHTHINSGVRIFLPGRQATAYVAKGFSEPMLPMCIAG